MGRELGLAGFDELQKAAGSNDLRGLVGLFEVSDVLRDDEVGFGRDSAFVDAVIIFVGEILRRPEVLTLMPVRSSTERKRAIRFLSRYFRRS